MAAKLAVSRILWALMALVALLALQGGLLALPTWALVNRALTRFDIQLTYLEVFCLLGAVQVVFLPILAAMLVILDAVQKGRGREVREG
jgi:hypothetical protein